MTAAPFLVEAAEIEALTGGQWIGTRRRVEIRGVAIDSRAVEQGMAFACLVGARVDGHDFAATAVGDGAVLIICQRPLEVPVPVLVVADTQTALGILAKLFRQRFVGATWIAVAGANGKTTVKELLLAACAEEEPTHATTGNRNNHLGVPLTILGTPAGTRWCIIELGANKGGEIAELAAMVQPDVGICTSLGPAHLEGYGSLQGVAIGESSVFAAVPEGGTCLFGREGLDAVAEAGGVAASVLEDLVKRAAQGRNLIIVGGDHCPVTGETRPDGIELHCGEGSVRLALLGRHNLANAFLAWRAAVAAGVIPEVAMRGLKRVRPVPGRLRLLRMGPHRLFDDCYNANPASMRAGLEELSRQHGARLAVLGAMGELGEEAPRMHRAVGADAARLGLPLLVVGSCSADDIGHGYRAAGGRDLAQVQNREQALTFIDERLAVGPTALLIKASHAAGLEWLVAAVLERHAGCAEGTAC